MVKYRFLLLVTLGFIFFSCNLGFASTVSNDIVLVIDNSGSMKKGDPHFETKRAVAEFVKKLSDDTQLAVLIFDHRVNLIVPLTVVSETNKKTILSSFNAIDYKGMLTNIPDAMKQAVFELIQHGSKASQKSIIFITDGVVDTGKKSRDIEKTKWLRKKLPEGATRHGVKIFGIAFTDLADFELIQFLVKKTNGEYFRARTSEDIPEIFSRIYQKILGKAPESIETASMPSTPSTETLQKSEYPVQENSQEAPPESEIEQSPIYITEKPRPTPDPVREEIKESASAPDPVKEEMKESSPVKHVMKKSGDLIPVSPKPKKFPLPLPIMILIAVAFVVAAMFILSRFRRRKTPVSVPPSQSHRPSPPEPVAEQQRPIGVPDQFMPEALLRDVSGVTGEDTYKISEKEIKIGRKEKLNQIVIDQETISRQHAIIEYKEYAYWIKDQDSANGTFLDGQKITDEMRLKSGDTISIDVYDFEFILPGLEGDADKTVFRKLND
jgi:uncharacterized protein YegL